MIFGSAALKKSTIMRSIWLITGQSSSSFSLMYPKRNGLIALKRIGSSMKMMQKSVAFGMIT
jgi:hypothetical protein